LETTESKAKAYSPNFKDLYAIYSRVRASKSFAVLEFGSGWSTLAFAFALKENKAEYESSPKSEIRHPNLFEIMTIDCSEEFMNLALSRIPSGIGIPIKPVVTQAYMSEVEGRICSLYEHFPPFTADFIYLDGPDCGPDQVSGNVNGFNVNFGNEEKLYGLPMAGDLLRVESCLWPGTEIVTDGRGANANYLRENFRRNWNYSYNSDVDQHLFYLDEPGWGIYSATLLKYKNRKLK